MLGGWVGLGGALRPLTNTLVEKQSLRHTLKCEHEINTPTNRTVFTVKKKLRAAGAEPPRWKNDGKRKKGRVVLDLFSGQKMI